MPYLVLASGVFALAFKAEGVIAIDDPVAPGEQGLPGVGGRNITLFGQANWIEPADTRGGFCDTAKGVAKMRWQLQGTHLVLSGVGTDPCGQRAFLFAGTWTLKP